MSIYPEVIRINGVELKLTCHTCASLGIKTSFPSRRMLADHLDSHGKIQSTKGK